MSVAQTRDPYEERVAGTNRLGLCRDLEGISRCGKGYRGTHQKKKKSKNGYSHYAVMSLSLHLSRTVQNLRMFLPDDDMQSPGCSR